MKRVQSESDFAATPGPPQEGGGSGEWRGGEGGGGGGGRGLHVLTSFVSLQSTIQSTVDHQLLITIGIPSIPSIPGIFPPSLPQHPALPDRLKFNAVDCYDRRRRGRRRWRGRSGSQQGHSRVTPGLFDPALPLCDSTGGSGRGVRLT